MSLVLRRVSLLAIAAMLSTGLAAGVGAHAAVACAVHTCGGSLPPPPRPNPSPPPPPPPPSIYWVLPSYGWAGDTVQVFGSDFTATGGTAAAKVTIAGVPAAFQWNLGLMVTVPPSLNQPGTQGPVVVTMANGTTVTGPLFTVSPTMSGERQDTFSNGCTDQFGGPIVADTTVNIDRSSGFIEGSTTLPNEAICSTTVNVAVVTFDSKGHMDAFSKLANPAPATGGISLSSSQSTTNWTAFATPSLVGGSHSFFVVQSVSGQQVLLSALSNLLQAGATVASVISTIG